MLHKGILGRKVGMTRVFLENGDAVACTLVEAGPCPVVQRKTDADEGYEAVQIGFLPKREKRVTKPMKGHFAKAGVEPTRHLAEIRLTEGDEAPEVGSRITCDIFETGDFVDVIGTMKGRGFTGVVKRHGFSTLKESHGGHFFVRHAGSIGSRKPQHTLRGTRMAGRHGGSPVTVQNLEVLRVDKEKNLLYVKGATPGPNGGLLLVRQALKRPPARS
ncbi:MAG: 50S ribosomal protein L3 [Planctomycetota bacterium]